MSILGNNDIIEDRDTVIIHIDFATLLAVRIDTSSTKSSTQIQTKYGAINLPELIGQQYGTKYQCKKGYVYVLRPTPELWTKTLPFRTQILYLPDISMIIMHLDLKPGSFVGESGTGSGSLSHAIARTIAPHGHLYTFDYHDVRVQQAQTEFANHGLSSIITAQKSDVYTDGYLTLDQTLDAVLLDLPKPWLAIPKVKKAMKRGGSRIGSFSPCIEQVQRSCKVMREEGFADIVTLECLMRPLEVKTMTMNVWQGVGVEKEDKRVKSPYVQTSFATAVVPREVPGHSGFLTFASLF